MINNTIAGVSTAVGNSGISVIRMSGPSAFSIADRLFKGRKTVKNQNTHTVQYGKIINPETGEMIDEVLLIKMEAPRTYTREDVVEISCHGGYTIARTLLNQLYGLGARPAEPGEFTKRAFLNGRIDLSQAEAVMDIIQARTERVSKVAVKQLEGSVSKKIDDIREKLIALLSGIEVNLDYPEYDAEEVTLSEAKKETIKIIADLDELIKSFRFGKLLREGMEVVIIGRPNVGKSSLMNRLTRKNRSIVTDIPGTTRDVIEEYVNIKGIPVKLVDTAGVRETEDQLEQLGVERSIRALESADFALILTDASQPLLAEDEEVITRAAGEKKSFVLIFNKLDLLKDEEKIDRLKKEYPDALFLSVKEDVGIEGLEEKIFDFAVQNNQDIDNQVLITNTRHEHQLKTARELLGSAVLSIQNGLTLDMVAMDIKAALEELGKITGHHADEDVVHAIFSRFCIGK
ncbi:MAG TPA: tRNA uridine-5-carboxymethylaminomethyl(34) synthesis GTPase MnmE [Ruminiclostridium sp.]|nr:tRNA uridine-5-carboxymethylaminomethyl(34) synthesis GTPase MnmE [Ruminiclostridium sp.]